MLDIDQLDLLAIDFLYVGLGIIVLMGLVAMAEHFSTSRLLYGVQGFLVSACMASMSVAIVLRALG